MADNKDKKVLNVPALRFPEFTGEWERHKLSEVCSFYSGGTPSSSKKEYYNGNIPFIRSGELHKDYTELFITEAGLSNSAAKLVETGDLLLALYGATSGDIAISKIKGAINQAILCIRTKQNKKFIESVWNKHVERLLQTYLQGGQGNLSADIVKNIPFYFANSNEQDKLAKFISLLDERIATQNKIIEDLKKLKSAIIEKVFCPPNQKQPVCRIKGFEQPLTTYKMNAFCSRIATKNMDAKCSLVLTIAAQYGLVNQGSFFNKSVASENLTGYYLLHKGEFAYNRSYSAGYDWRTVKRLDNCDEGVLSTLYICFKINETIVDSDFLTYYFESTKWHKGLSDIAGEGARNHGLLNVSMTDYFNTKHRFPSMEEQKVIAKMLNAITEREKKAIVLGECYRKQKQFLLCQMFI